MAWGMTKLEKFRSDLATLFEVFAAATGRKLSNISVAVASDSKFAATFGERDMRVGTYDMVTERFSAIWPADLPWPEGIERPAPAPIEEISFRATRATSSIHPDWPADKPWPADIPRPVSHSQPIDGQGA